MEKKTGVSLPLHFVPSPTGLPSKRCPGIGFISRADQEIGAETYGTPRSRKYMHMEVQKEKEREN